MNNFRRLAIWQRAYRLSLEIIRLADNFSGVARYPLGNQLVRAAISIPSNIAEGSGRGSDKDFKRFLAIALGSAYELDTQVQIARDLDLISPDVSRRLLTEVTEIQRMIHGLRHNLTTESDLDAAL